MTMSQLRRVHIVSPLKYNDNIISWPYINPNEAEQCVLSILVNITNNGHVSFISLKHAMATFDRKYNTYLNQHKDDPLFPAIIAYFDDYIEAELHFKYCSGMWGWLKNENDITKALCRIERTTDYVTERFYLHDVIQKYEITTYNITSQVPLKWTNEQLCGNAQGWIKEKEFIHIEKTKEMEPPHGFMLNWMFCRESYLLKTADVNQQTSQTIIQNRGIVFTQSTSQYLVSECWKPMRGKITQKLRGTIAEVAFRPPPNFWSYLIEKKLKKIKNMSDEDPFNIVEKKQIIPLNIFELADFISFEYFVKFYDQYGNAFRIKDNVITTEQLQTINTKREGIKLIIDKLNSAYKQKYDEQKANNEKKKKTIPLRKVSNYVSFNRARWIRTMSSGRTIMKFNVYKCTLLGNNTYNFEGVINDF